MYRPSSDPDFSRQDVARFRALLPHFQRAVQLQKRLQAVPHGTANIHAMLAAIGKPTLLADHNARLLCANPAGEALLRDRSLILAEGGQLAARNRDETNRLRKLIHSAAKQAPDSSGGKMIVRREDRASLVLLVAPLPGAHYGVTDQLAILFADDPERERTNPPDLELLHAQYQLTHAEAGLAVLLLSSSNLRCAASRQNIAFSTARTHLAHIFQKTGAHSQLELIRMLRKAGHDN
jgi:DNA-binding CsgD family transcriptional regulator